MPNANLLKPDNNIHALLIGKSGCGKTGAAVSFPGKSYVLDFDDRIRGIMGCPFLDQKIKNGEVEWATILPYESGGPKTQGLAEVYKQLEIVDAKVNAKQVDTVILDSVSSMVRFFVNESVNRSLATSGKGSSLNHFKIGEAVMAGKPDHNYAATCIANVIYENMKSWRCNIFISSHFKDRIVPAPTPEDPERTIVTGQVLKAPGQLSEEIPSWFNETWEFTKDASVTSQPPRYYVNFQSGIAKTTFRVSTDSKVVTANDAVPFKLDITGRSLYECLKPYLEKRKGA